MVELLIKSGVDVNSFDGNHKSALHRATTLDGDLCNNKMEKKIFDQKYETKKSTSQFS